MPPCTVAADIIPRVVEECNGKIYRYLTDFLDAMYDRIIDERKNEWYNVYKRLNE